MRLRLTAALLLLSCATTPTAPDSSAQEVDPAKVAETYLNALSGAGDDSGRELLLGGATANARLFILENWRIVAEGAPQHEEGELEVAAKMMSELDEASRAAIDGIMGADAGTESDSFEQLTPQAAAELMGPTQASADRLMAALPLLGSVLRVGESIYWSPRNPARATLASAGTGRYVLDTRVFEVETIEGPRKVPRRFPLRLLRLKTAALNTSWKVLPASDWNAE